MVRHLDTPYSEEQVRQFVPGLPSSLEELTIRHCENAIVALMTSFLLGELPQALKSIHLEFGDDAAMKPQFQRGQSLIETALKRGVVLTLRVLATDTVYCDICEDYDTRTREQ